MLRTAVEERLRDEQSTDARLFPAYGGYCFGSVPDTIRSLLDAGGDRPLPGDVFEGVRTDVSNVVTVVVDGYGLDSWKRDRDDHRFLDRLTERGTVTPLTSIYPSETAAAMTTFETGQLPCEHGRIGWNVYEPETDQSFLALTGEVKASDDPSFVYGYVPDVDHVSHAEGTDSAAFQETLSGVCRQLSAFVDRLDAETAAETLLVVTADHGHVNTDPERNVDLSVRADVVEHLRTHGDNTPVRLSGSPRHVHLHLRDGEVDAARDAPGDLDASLLTRAEALDRDHFGDREPSERFRRRCGDLVVTHRDLGTWWGDVEPDELDLVGMHGGLHPAEMLVPFATVGADRL